ncbi:hypothetical protein AB0H57_06580 [Micromonospora sp. NPDC050686]|uniref:hypothetical protein n=1 Tax=Micromonospora sp. NPDC050686 TaxID=3154631 RepID=UPI0033CA0D79
MSTLTRDLNARDRVRSYERRRVELPVLGEVAMPPPDKLAYYAGIGVLAAFQVIQWPVALVITAGHLLADQRVSGLAKGMGEALESA